MQRLISSLFHNWYGKPILVIGGGPSVIEDLPRLDITPACVISANNHGYHQNRFPITLVVNCDKKHCTAEGRPHMGTFLREYTDKYGGAIVNKFAFADYRLGNWKLDANSGLTAVAVACALGGNPVIVTGIDLWGSGRSYFHDGTARSARLRVSKGKVPTNRKVTHLEAFVRGANVRPMSGPMLEAFKRYEPGEVLPAPKDIAYRRAHLDEKAVLVSRDTSWKWETQDIVPAGTTMALTPSEAQDLQQRKRLR